jgi:hypothetical protein
LTTFLENYLHPILNLRYQKHPEQMTKGLKAAPDDISKAGIAGSHGEIRALNDLLFYIERSGVKVTDDIFNEITAYNRFLRKLGVQPPCTHCFYITDGIKYIGLIK